MKELTNTKDRYSLELPELLYEELIIKALDVEFISLDLATYLLNLILNKIYMDKNKDYEDGFIRLCSKLLKPLNKDGFSYKKHFDWMRDEGFIEISNHRNFDGTNTRCKGYKIVRKYIFDNNNYVKHDCKNDKLKKAFNLIGKQRKNEAKYSTPHLTKWLDDDKFTFDDKAAIDYVNHEYQGSDNIHKRNKRIKDIESFNTSNRLDYSREGKDDRLHHYYVKMSGDLKQFVRYDGETLKEVDIKSAQPFILTIIMEAYVKYIKSNKNNKEIIDEITLFIRSKINSKSISTSKSNKNNIRTMIKNSIMLLESYESLDIIELKMFISLVRTGDVYMKIGNILYKKGAIWKKDDFFYTKLGKKVKGSNTIQKEKVFKTLRECAKQVFLNYIFSNPDSTSVAVINTLRGIYPSVNLFLDSLKLDDYRDLPILMQRIESKCVLDYCSKNIARKHPNMPLVARHDSLSTTEGSFDLLEVEFRILLNKYFGVEVDVGVSIW